MRASLVAEEACDCGRMANHGHCGARTRLPTAVGVVCPPRSRGPPRSRRPDPSEFTGPRARTTGAGTLVRDPLAGDDPGRRHPHQQLTLDGIALAVRLGE